MLNLNVNRTVGRAAKPVAAAEVRQLSAADLVLLTAEKGVSAPPIKKLRDSHHALARALAAGCKPAQCQIITGYSASRISILQADPAFQELVSHYAGHENDAHADMIERMKTLGLDALEELRERMEENPEDFSPSMLLEITKVMADRTGAGPATKSTSVQVNVNYADAVKAARERSMIDVSPAVTSLPSGGKEESVP